MTALPAPALWSGPRKRPWWAFAIAAATLLFYLPALHNKWIWDDSNYVTENVYLNTLHGLQELWTRPGAVPQYYPLTHTTFWIEHHLWAIEPLGYHLDNILLHACNAILLGLILRRLNVPGWKWAAALFALHPVQVESVAWVTERKNVLSGLFYLLCLGVALDQWHITAGGKLWRSGPIGYALCIVLFACALLSKSVTSSLPVVILILMGWKRRKITLSALAKLAPFFAMGAAMGTMTAWMEVHVVGATGPDFHWSAPMRVLIAGRAICFYLGKLLWPHPLIFIYPKWRIDPGNIAQWLFPLAVVAGFAALLLLRKKLGRAPIAAALFFVVTLFPALGFVNVYPMRYSYVADHFQYLACIGPLTLAGFALHRARWLGFPLLAVLGTLSFIHTTTFYDMPTVFADIVSKDPSSVLGHNNLGAGMIEQGRLAEASVELHKCLALDPHFVEAWCGLGSIAEKEKAPRQALTCYKAAQAAAPDNPTPLYRIGLLYRRTGDPDAAKAAFTQDLRLLHNPAVGFEQLGEIELTQDHPGVAKARFRQALAYNPDFDEAHNNLAAIAIDEHDLQTAQAQSKATLSIEPLNTTALNNMGVISIMHNDAQTAARYFHQVLAIDPNFTMAKKNLELLGEQR